MNLKSSKENLTASEVMEALIGPAMSGFLPSLLPARVTLPFTL